MTMTMKDWAQRLDGFLNFNAYPILGEGNYGKITREDAERHAIAEYEKLGLLTRY